MKDFTNKETKLAKAIWKIMRRDERKAWRPVELWQALQRRRPGRFTLAEVRKGCGKANWRHSGLDIKIDIGSALQRAGFDKTAISSVLKVVEKRVTDGQSHLLDTEEFEKEATKQSLLAWLRSMSVPVDWSGTADEYYEEVAAFYSEVILTATKLGIQPGESLDPAFDIVMEKGRKENDV